MTISAMTPFASVSYYSGQSQNIRLGESGEQNRQSSMLPELSRFQTENPKKANSKIDPENPTGECQTCKNRKYQDGSDDPGVSFKSPAKIDPQTVASEVRGHELEHVYREQFKAAQEGRKVISQSVTLHTGICPECGKSYVSGGTTRTVTKGAGEGTLFQVGLPDDKESGKNLSMAV